MSDSPTSVTPMSSPIDQDATDTATGTMPFRHVIRTITGADEPTYEEDIPPSRATVPASTAYPHLFDVTQAAGQAIQYVRQALEDAKGSLEGFGDADLDAVQTKLRLVATQLAAAHPLVDFNRDFANVVAFLRRATLSVSATEVNREMLNALVATLQTLIDSPTISLMDAAKLTQTLEEHRWSGSHKAVEALLRSLLEQPDAERQAQGDMFGPYAFEVVRARF